jgi:hypothetical protein
MNKQKILELTGLSEDQFYDQYPDQETFCSDYPDACNQLEKAQGGTEITPEMKSNWNAYVQANKANITPDWNRMQTDPTTHEKYYPGNRALEQWNASNPSQAIQSSYIPAIQQSFNDIQGSNSQLGTRMQSSFKNRTGADAYSKKDAIIGTLTGNQLFPIGREETYHNNQLIAQKNYGTNVNASTSQPAYASNTPVVPAMGTSYTAPPPVTQPQRARTPFDYDVPQPAPVVRQNTQMTAMNPSVGATTSYGAPPQRMTAKQTMNTVGSTGATSVSSLNAPPSSIPLQNTIAAASSKYTPPVSSMSSSKVDPNSVVDAMKSKGMDSSFASRKKLAEEKGITGYTGTASQNTILKNKINTPPPVSKERGGTAIFPSMRNFKQGGYYGMDQKFHPNSDSGTYVTGAGYYFDPGGQTGQFQIDPNQQGAPITSDAPPGGQIGAIDLNQGDNQNSQYNYPDQTIPEGQTNQQAEPFSLEGYNSSINPATGFKDWSKDGKVINNIKRDDPNLWNNLAETGHGARWETGQTDFQKVGKVAGKIAQGIQGTMAAGTMTAGMITQQQQRKNMSNAATNLGSTNSMFTNPQSAGKGDYVTTGSGYGQFKPNQMGNLSFKGMYGKYGMQVPKYAVGGFDPELNVIDDSYMPQVNESSELDLSSLYTLPNVQRDNTRVAPPIIPVNVRQSFTQSNDNTNIKDLIATQESGGDYKALPWLNKAHTKLASSAAGKYQFLWEAHKDDIQKVTGVKTKQDFLNNPNAQEEFFDYWDNTTLTPWANKIKSQLNIQLPINKIKAAIHFSGPKGAWNYFSKGIASKDNFGMSTGNYMNNFKYGGQQQGGQVVEMDENQIQQFLAAGGQLEFLD